MQEAPSWTLEQAQDLHAECCKKTKPFEDGFFVMQVPTGTSHDTRWNLFRAGFEVWMDGELTFLPPGGSHVIGRFGNPRPLPGLPLRAAEPWRLP